MVLTKAVHVEPLGIRHSGSLGICKCRIEDRDKWRQIFDNRRPEDIQIHVEIGVNEPVAHRNDLGERYPRQVRPCLGSHFGRLAEDLQTGVSAFSA